MRSALRFEGLGGRALYLAVSLGVFFCQHVAVILAEIATHHPLPTVWWFWVNPFRVLVPDGFLKASDAAMSFGMLATFVVDALLLWLAFARGRWSSAGGWVATLAIVPIVQLGVIAWLTIAPDDSTLKASEEEGRRRLDAKTAALGLISGVGLVVLVVALSTLLFGLYGYTLFLVSPFLIAVAVAYLANRRGRIGGWRTFVLVNSAFVLGAAALLGFAFEGLICLVLAFPLILGMAGLGTLVGILLTDFRKPGRSTTLASVAVLPFLLAGEALLPPRAAFESVESTEVAASPAAVWDAVVHMGPIPDAPAAPFRWGLAYPMRGEIMGHGVGAIRRGVFSTGVAYERVTEWEPQSKLSFIVLSDPPTMNELSPYDHLKTPHLRGYFRTLDARFTLTPLANGHTRLKLSTRHELDLEPALYWIPIAEWAVHANKTRVLANFRRQAEAGTSGVGGT